MVPLFDWALMFMFMARFLVMKGHKKKSDTCHDEIGLCDPNIDVNGDPIIA